MGTDPKDLPVRQYASQIAQSVRDNPVTVVIGETGSGKTTQISQILEEAGFADTGAIAITQPRRVVRARRPLPHPRRPRFCCTAGAQSCPVCPATVLRYAGDLLLEPTPCSAAALRRRR